MRPAIYVAALVACAAIAPETLQTVLASACSVILEALPYLAASVAAARVAGRAAHWALAYAGCGCGAGPGARSIPVAWATLALFGPGTALARWLAAVAISHVVGRRVHEHAHTPSLLQGVAALVPSAVACGIVVSYAHVLSPAHALPVVQIALGAAIGFIASPCALGGVALAATFHASAPLLATSLLCVSGICDRPVWFTSRANDVGADRTTYWLLAAACAVVASQHGAALVHPRLTIPLWGCCAYLIWLGARASAQAATAANLLAALLVIACVIGSPPPPSAVVAATLDDAYAGEPIDFTGRYEEDSGAARVVRYAITCCRADARPVAIRLNGDNATYHGHWVRVRGVFRESPSGPIVAAASVSPVTPPADPFIYR